MRVNERDLSEKGRFKGAVIKKVVCCGKSCRENKNINQAIIIVIIVIFKHRPN